jgi:hypothetical protein
MDGTRWTNIWILFLPLVCVPTVLTLLAGISGCGAESTSLQRGANIPLPLVVSPYPQFDFGLVPVGGSATSTFTVTNIGTKMLTEITSGFYLSLNFQFEGGEFPGASGTCMSTLEPQQSCKLVIVFSPKYVGSFAEAVRVNFHDGTSEKSTDSPLLYGRSVAGGL